MEGKIVLSMLLDFFLSYITCLNIKNIVAMQLKCNWSNVPPTNRVTSTSADTTGIIFLCIT